MVLGRKGAGGGADRAAQTGVRGSASPPVLPRGGAATGTAGPRSRRAAAARGDPAQIVCVARMRSPLRYRMFLW
uniref:Uncharacterized protein n=1 Tax=Suricata suricatta TaxID=37032 RepID=A0A673VF97_SURSU